MRILITGGAGFIGSHLSTELINAGHHIVIVDNLSTGKAGNIPQKAVFYQEDIVDGKRIEEIFNRERPEIVYHLAAQTSVPFSMEKPEDDARVNIMGSINVLNACVSSKAGKFIFTSSAAVYGKPENLPVNENHPIRPLSGYGISKHTVEHYTELFAENYGIKYIIFRCANVYGEKQERDGEAGVVSVFMDALIKDKLMYIHGDGEQTRDFIYVRDVVTAALQAIDNGENGIINISTGLGITVNKLITVMENASRKTARVEKIEPRSGDIKNSVLSNQLACRLLGWKPAFSLEDGLLNMWRHQPDK